MYIYVTLFLYCDFCIVSGCETHLNTGLHVTPTLLFFLDGMIFHIKTLLHFGVSSKERYQSKAHDN